MKSAQLDITSRGMAGETSYWTWHSTIKRHWCSDATTYVYMLWLWVHVRKANVDEHGVCDSYTDSWECHETRAEQQTGSAQASVTIGRYWDDWLAIGLIPWYQYLHRFYCSDSGWIIELQKAVSLAQFRSTNNNLHVEHRKRTVSCTIIYDNIHTNELYM